MLYTKILSVIQKSRMAFIHLPLPRLTVGTGLTFRHCTTPLTTSVAMKARNKITLNFEHPDGKVTSVPASVGDNLLDCIVDNDVEIDGYGACEGTLACSTCHLVFSQEDYDSLPEKPTDEEMDMLDLAYGLTETSRLGCQVYVTQSMNDWKIKVPEESADARDV